MLEKVSSLLDYFGRSDLHVNVLVLSSVHSVKGFPRHCKSEAQSACGFPTGISEIGV